MYVQCFQFFFGKVKKKKLKMSPLLTILKLTGGTKPLVNILRFSKAENIQRCLLLKYAVFVSLSFIPGGLYLSTLC